MFTAKSCSRWRLRPRPAIAGRVGRRQHHGQRVRTEGRKVGRQRFTSFSRAAAEGHLRALHARCPPELLERFIDVLATREWAQPVTIGQAFGLVAQAHVRHAMTDYDRVLRLPGVTREERQGRLRSRSHYVFAGWRPRETPRATCGRSDPHRARRPAGRGRQLAPPAATEGR